MELKELEEPVSPKLDDKELLDEAGLFLEPKVFRETSSESKLDASDKLSSKITPSLNFILVYSPLFLYLSMNSMLTRI
jgi:hypothetical protein